ncbi:MAG: hypothetical protein ABI114_16290 [Rhodanobacter sp.]
MKRPLRVIAAAAVFAVLAACTAPSNSQADSGTAPMSLKIYAVPPAQTAQLRASLGQALGKNASITAPTPGKLLVYAPVRAQASINAALTDLSKSAPTEEVPAQVNLHFWVVDAQAGAGADDAALKPLASALDAVRKNMGPLHFQLDQAVSAMASLGHNGSIKTATEGGYARGFNFQINSAHANTINLQLSYDDAGQSGLAQFDTQIDVQSGHYVVLAQAPGACAPALPGRIAPACPEKPTLRLLIVRADRLNPPA